MHTCMTMGSTTISLNDDAYQHLKRLKREDESFSDVVLRLTNQERDLDRAFGALAGTDFRAGVKQARRELREGMEEDIEEMN